MIRLKRAIIKSFPPGMVLNEVIRGMVTALEEARRSGHQSPPRPGSDIDTALEQKGEGACSEPLDSELIRAISWNDIFRARRPYTIGIDGGSRRLETPYGSFAMAAVCVCHENILMMDYPPLLRARRITRLVPFIAAQSHLDVPPNFFIKQSPAQHPYDETYKIADVAHEIRTELETFALDELVPEALKLFGMNPRDVLVILDGPLYQTVWRYIEWVPNLKDDWVVLTRRRVGAIDKLINEYGIPIVASVKRLDKSKYLLACGARGPHGLIENILGVKIPRQSNDQAEAYAMAEAFIGVRRLIGLVPIVIGPFKIAASAMVPPEVKAPDRAYVYAIVPKALWPPSHVDIISTVFRLETTLELYEQIGFDIFLMALADTGYTFGLPCSQAWADHYSKRLCTNIYKQACGAILTQGLSLSYDTLVAYLGVIS